MEHHPTPDRPTPQGPAPVQEPGRKRGGKRWLVLPLVAAAGIAFGVPALQLDSDGAPSAASTASSNTIPAAPSPSPAASVAPAAPVAPAADSGPTAARPIGFSFRAAGIDMAVLPLTPTDADLASQNLVPPLTIDAYWLTSYGVPGAGSNNTTYIAGHSWDGQDAPFNALSDESLVGGEFVLTTETGDLTYVVDSVTTYDKDTLKDSDIWDIVPNRVVLISCYTEDPWGKNVVVTAMPKAA